MKLTSGSETGHFRILSQIGKVGMGEVYLAQDTKLERTGADMDGRRVDRVLLRRLD